MTEKSPLSDKKLQSTKTFFLVEPIDMYHKLWWEMTKARNSEGSSPRETAYAALNAAMTGWHLAEWIAERLTPEQFENLRKAGHDVKGKYSMQQYAKTSHSMAMIEQIANAAKHYKIDERPREVTTFDAWLDPADGRDHIWVPMVKDGSSNMPLSIALGFVVSFWRKIFLDSKLATIEELESMLPQKQHQAKGATDDV